MRVVGTSALLFLTTALASPAAGAEPPEAPGAEPRAELAMMAGVGAAMIPVILGAAMTSSGTTDAEKDRGFGVMGAGFVLAPLVSHAVLGEGKRAAAFTAVPLLSEIGMVWLMAGRPDAVFHGTMLSRTTFGTLMCFDVFFAALGVTDAALAGNENPRGRWGLGSILTRVHIAPTVAAGRLGITVGGAL